MMADPQTSPQSYPTTTHRHQLSRSHSGKSMFKEHMDDMDQFDYMNQQMDHQFAHHLPARVSSKDAMTMEAANAALAQISARSRAYSQPHNAGIVWHESYTSPQDERVPRSVPTSRYSQRSNSVQLQQQHHHGHDAAYCPVTPGGPRRDSESSTSSSTFTTNSTPPSNRTSWSTVATAESLSPTSPPHIRATVTSPTHQRKSSKSGDLPPLPENQSPASSGRTAWAGGRARSGSKRFQNTPIEAMVPEEDEHADVLYMKRREKPLPKAMETALPTLPTSPDSEHTVQSPPPLVSNLHQRRMQRQNSQQKTATYSAFPPPSKAVPPLMPALPLSRKGSCDASDLAPPRRLNRNATRSLPQLRGHIGPPPSEPLPPLPTIAQISPMFPKTPTCFSSPFEPTSQAPQTLPQAPLQTPAPAPVPTQTLNQAPPPPLPLPALDISPPHPSLPPPPPPQELRPSSSSAGSSVSGEATSPASSHGVAEKAEKQPARKPSTRRMAAPLRMARDPETEAEVQRHKQFLAQFPARVETQSEPQRGRLKLSRSYKSLGNLRSRSRAQSMADSQRDKDKEKSVAATPAGGIVQTTSATVQVSSRSSTPTGPTAAKHSKGTRAGRAGKQDGGAIVSVFEEDSDDEGDGVRRFMRSIFSRRTRSSEMVSGTTIVVNQYESKSSSSSLSNNNNNNNHINNNTTTATSSNNNSNVAITDDGHNRKKNSSTSSALSMATTVGTNNTVCSSTTTIVATNSETGSVTGSAANSLAESHSPTPTDSGSSSSSSADAGRSRGPLLTRMFVRRSH